MEHQMLVIYPFFLTENLSQRPSFSSSETFSLLIFIEKHLYGHTEVQSAFTEHETVPYPILKCWLPLYFIYSFMLIKNTGGERMDRLSQKGSEWWNLEAGIHT